LQAGRDPFENSTRRGTDSHGIDAYFDIIS